MVHLLLTRRVIHLFYLCIGGDKGFCVIGAVLLAGERIGTSLLERSGIDVPVWLGFILAVTGIAALGALLAALVVVPLRMINKSVTKSQVQAQIDLWRAQEERERRKFLAWNCPFCGAANYNREFCEFCGNGKPNRQ